MAEFEQKSLGWRKDRLGKWTGSMVGKLMMIKKNGDFYDTALSYIYQVAATRSMNEDIVEDDNLFQEYVDCTEFTSKPIRFGIEQEENARNLYADLKKVDVIERGSIEHDSIPFFASSPDGFIPEDIDGKSGCLEIKCPNQATYMKYRNEIVDDDSFIKCNSDYYYQCQAHIMCAKVDYCDFVVYCPWQSIPIFIYRVFPDLNAQQLMTINIYKAECIVKGILNK